MDDRSNTIAGWVLGAGIVFLGAWLVTGEYFHNGRPEPMGYPIAGVVEEGETKSGPAEQPIAFYLQTADAARGATQFARCSGCHTITPGGANGQGPNLHGRMGAAIAAHPGYAYSEALRAHAPGPWTWENMSAWLANPRAFAPGTKMGFAGLSDPQARADLLVYLNAQGGNLQIPPPPAAAAPAGNEAAPADAPGENAARAADAPAAGDQGTPQPQPKGH